LVKNEILTKIKEYETIIIHRHVRPDPDAIGSQVGLRKIIQETYPNKFVYAVGEEDPSLYFLAQMDEITEDVYKGALILVCDTANTSRISDRRYELGDYIIKIDHHPNNDNYGDFNWVDTEASSTSELIDELASHIETLQMTDEAAWLIYAGIIGDTERFLFYSTSFQIFHYSYIFVLYNFIRYDIFYYFYV